MLSTFKTVLSKKTQLISSVYLYHFDLLEPREIIFKAGQYLMLKIPTDKGPISRLYSIASSPLEKNNFELIIQMIPEGLASGYLSNFKENDQVVFQGPAGTFGLKENNRPKIFLVTGTGIAPIKSMLISNKSSLINNLYLFWGIKKYQDAYLFKELKDYGLRKTNFKIKICLSQEQDLNQIPETDRQYFDLAHVDSCLDKLLTVNYELLTTSDFYLCGSRTVVESLLLFLLSKSVARENIYFEKF